MMARASYRYRQSIVLSFSVTGMIGLLLQLHEQMLDSRYVLFFIMPSLYKQGNILYI